MEQHAFVPHNYLTLLACSLAPSKYTEQNREYGVSGSPHTLAGLCTILCRSCELHTIPNIGKSSFTTSCLQRNTFTMMDRHHTCFHLYYDWGGKDGPPSTDNEYDAME